VLPDMLSMFDTLVKISGLFKQGLRALPESDNSQLRHLYPVANTY
jgi:hypothetical protein